MLQQNKKKNSIVSVSIETVDSVVSAKIETSRLFIRLYQSLDFKNCVSLYGDPKLSKYFDHGKPRNENEVESLIEVRSGIFTRNGIPLGLFSVFDKKDMNFIGQVDLLPTNENGTLEIGCILLREYHNQKFAIEALEALIVEYLYELNKNLNYSINKIIATVHPKNFASKKLVEMLGMRFEKNIDRFDAPRLLYSYIPN